MQARLRGLQRIAAVYAAMNHAQSLSLEEASGALREAESRIDQQRSQMGRTSAAGRAALVAGEHEEWKIHESQNQFTELNTESLVELRRRREALLFEAAEGYRAASMRLEQMESVVREVRSQMQTDVNRRAQRESDDRFAARRWWQEQTTGILGERLDKRTDDAIDGESGEH